jgi:hypothetical protein
LPPFGRSGTNARSRHGAPALRRFFGIQLGDQLPELLRILDIDFVQRWMTSPGRMPAAQRHR